MPLVLPVSSEAYEYMYSVLLFEPDKFMSRKWKCYSAASSAQEVYGIAYFFEVTEKQNANSVWKKHNESNNEMKNSTYLMRIISCIQVI
jgi:hypothetical protein